MEPPVGDIVTAIGWGTIADDQPGNVDNLREVDVPVESDTVAEGFYPGFDFTTKVKTSKQTNLLGVAIQLAFFHLKNGPENAFKKDTSNPVCYKVTLFILYFYIGDLGHFWGGKVN